MNPDLSAILSLRKVLESAGDGMGLARSLVKEIGGVKPLGSDVARMILLGHPISVSLRPIVEYASQEVSMLASLIVSAPRSSTSLVGRSGEALSTTLERWVKARESGKLEDRALRFRSLVTSGVLGAVTAMLASLGPLVGNLNFNAGAPPVNAGTLTSAAGAMTAISSGMLGYFMSGRGLFVNIATSLVVFTIVSVVASPLAAIQSVGLWGVK